MLTGGFNPHTSPEYLKYEAMGNEIAELFTNKQTEKIETITAANAPKASVKCTACGATTLPDAQGCCEYCGSPLKK